MKKYEDAMLVLLIPKMGKTVCLFIEKYLTKKTLKASSSREEDHSSYMFL